MTACTRIFTVVFIIVIKYWNQPKYPLIEKWINYINTTEYYEARKEYICCIVFCMVYC